MTSINQDTPAAVSSVKDNEATNAPRGSRRRRSLKRAGKRKLQRYLRLGNLFRVGAIALVLLAFLQITFKNDVLNPSSKPALPSQLAGSDSALLRTPTGTRVASSDLYAQDEATATPRYELASWVTESLEKVARATGSLTVNSDNKLKAPESDISQQLKSEFVAPSPDKEIYVVNDGGSLWRTGRRFISDEVLLDKLIDSLSENGVNVSTVKAGQEILVNKLDNQDLLVTIEIGESSFESRVSVNDVVTTSRRRNVSDIN